MKLAALLLFITAVLFTIPALSQTASVSANVNLRPDPSTDHPAIAKITKGTQVRVLSASPQNGFLHVRFQNKNGWVSAKYVSGVATTHAAGTRKLAKVPSKTEAEEFGAGVETAGPTARATRSSSSACGGVHSLAACTTDGCSPPGSTHALANQLKRRVPSSTGTPVILTFDDFQNLQNQADSLVGEDKELTAEDRGKLTNLSVSSGTVSEGDVVSIVGYLVGLPHPNTGESVNCNLRGPRNNDFHIPISNDPSNTDFQGIVVEMIPQDRPSEWSIDNLTQVENASQMVMATGALFYDNFHRVNGDENNPVGSQPHRFSLWEVHPITQFVVCSKSDNSCDPAQTSDWTPLGSGSPQ